ncbi:hypothetical protein GEMRC1_011508 [Eukaryota sp. GEM-RC1]
MVFCLQSKMICLICPRIYFINELSEFQVNELSDVSLVVSNLKNLLVMLSNSNADLDKKYSNISTTCVELEATLQQLKTENSRISSDLSLTNNEVDRLRSVQNQTLMEKEEAQTKLQDQISSLIEGNDVLNVTNTLISELQENCSKLSTTNHQLSEELTERDSQLLNLDQQFNNLNSTLSEVQSENLNLKSIGAQQSEELNSLQSNLDDVFSSIKNDLFDLSSDLLRNELSDFQVNELSDVSLVVSNLKNLLVMLSNSNADLGEKYSNISTTCVELEATLEQLKTENSRISSDLSLTNDEIDRLKSIQKQTLMEREEIQTKLQDQISSLIEYNDVLNLNLTKEKLNYLKPRLLFLNYKKIVPNFLLLITNYQQFNNLNSTLSELQSENLNLIGAQQSEELNSLQSNLDDVFSSIKNDLFDLSSDLLRNELSDFQVNELSDVSLVVSNLKNLLVMLSNSNADLDEKYSNISTTCVELEATLEQLKTENSRISSDLSLTNDEIDRLKSIQKQTLMEKEEIQTKLQDQISSLIEYNDVLNLNLTKEKLNYLKPRLLFLNYKKIVPNFLLLITNYQQFNNLNSTLSELQSENLNLIGAQQSEELNSLQSNLDDVLPSIKNDLFELSSNLLRNELSDFQVNELSDVSSVVSNLKNQLVMLSNSNVDLNKKYSNISTTCVELEATLLQLKTENSRISSDFSEPNSYGKEEVQTKLQDQISSLIEGNDVLNLNLTKRETELSEAKTLISELQENCSKLSTTNHQLSEELTERDSQLLNLDQQFNNLNSTLSEVQSENLNLKSIGAQQSEELNCLQSNLDGVLSSIKNDLSDLSSDLLRNELSDFQVNELSDVTVVVSNLKNLLVILLNSNVDLNTKCSNISTTCVELEATLEQLKTENSSISSDLSLTNDEIDRLKSVQNQTLMEKEEVQTKLKDQISSLIQKTELSEAKTLISELQENCSKLSTTYHQLSEELTEKNSQLLNLDQQFNNLNSTLSEVQSENLNLKSIGAQQSEKLNSLQSNLDGVLSSIKNDLSDLSSDLLRNELSDFQVYELSDVSLVVSNLKNLLVMLSNSNADLNKKYSNISTTCVELEATLEQLKTENFRISNALSFTNDEINRLKSIQNQTLMEKKNNDVLNLKLAKRETELSEAKTLISELQENCSKLSTTYHQLSEELTEKNSQLLNLDQQFNNLNSTLSEVQSENLNLKSIGAQQSEKLNSLQSNLDGVLSSIKNDLSDLSSDLLRNELSDFQVNELSDVSLVVSNLKNLLVMLSNSNADLNKKYSNISTTCVELEATLEQLKPENFRISNDLSLTNDEIDRLKSNQNQTLMERKNNDVLNLKLTKGETELSEAKTLISELQENCSKLSTTNHQLSEELTEKDSQLLNLDQQFNNLNSTLSEVQSDNLNLKSIGAQQSEELNSLQSNLDCVLSSIKNDLSDLSSDLLRNELSAFQVNELSDVTVVVSNLKNLLVMLSNSNADLNKKYSNISTTCVELEATLEQLKTENFRISNDLSLTNDEIDRLKSNQNQTLMERKNNDVLNLKLTKEETELSEAKTLISELQENCSKLSTTNHQLSEELTERDSQLLNLDQQFNNLNSTLSEVQSESLNLKSIGAQQSEKLNSLQSNLDGVLSSIKNDLSALSSDLLRNELSDFQVNELSDVSLVVSNLKNLLVMLSNSNADLNKKYSNISTTCVELEATLEQLKTENFRISNDLSLTNDEIDRLKSNQNQTLMEKEDVQTKLQDQISSLIQSNDVLNLKLTKEETELSEAKTLISELQENCSKLSTTNHQLSEELTEKDSQLLNLDQQFNNLNSTLSEVQSDNLNLKSIGAQQSEELNSLQSNLDCVLSSIKNDLSDLSSGFTSQ